MEVVVVTLAWDSIDKESDSS
ncbi:Protein of unknown function [Bacillus cereus]|nr:Protein of unknown function [Bacillus cereus]